jgi:hypothetical protein
MTIKVGEHISPETEYKTFYPITDKGTKICTHCLCEKSVNDFGRYRNGNPLPHCRKCENKKARNCRLKKPEVYRRTTRRYYNKNKGFDKKKRNLWQKCWSKGITVKQYLEMFRSHNGCCDICGVPNLELKRNLAIDHDHITGKIRGLLCINCNMALGGFRDNPEILEKAISYLKKHQEVKV